MYKVFRQRAPELAQLFKDERGPLDGRDVQQVPLANLTDNYQMRIEDVLWDHEVPKSSWWGWLWRKKLTHQQEVDAQANLYIDKFVRYQVASLGRIVGSFDHIRYAVLPSIEERKIGAFQHVVYTDNVPFRITIEYRLEIPTGAHEWNAAGDLIPVTRPGTSIVVDTLCQEAREICSV